MHHSIQTAALNIVYVCLLVTSMGSSAAGNSANTDEPLVLKESQYDYAEVCRVTGQIMGASLELAEAERPAHKFSSRLPLASPGIRKYSMKKGKTENTYVETNDKTIIVFARIRAQDFDETLSSPEGITSRFRLNPAFGPRGIDIGCDAESMKIRPLRNGEIWIEVSASFID